MSIRCRIGWHRKDLRFYNGVWPVTVCTRCHDILGPKWVKEQENNKDKQ